MKEFENLSATGTSLTGIKIEAGWTAGFTAQDGITVMTYTIASTAASGTGFFNEHGDTFCKPVPVKLERRFSR
jgi:hypothetical protein